MSIYILTYEIPYGSCWNKAVFLSYDEAKSFADDDRQYRLKEGIEYEIERWDIYGNLLERLS